MTPKCLSYPSFLWNLEGKKCVKFEYSLSSFWNTASHHCLVKDAFCLLTMYLRCKICFACQANWQKRFTFLQSKTPSIFYHLQKPIFFAVISHRDTKNSHFFVKSFFVPRLVFWLISHNIFALHNRAIANLFRQSKTSFNQSSLQICLCLMLTSSYA